MFLENMYVIPSRILIPLEIRVLWVGLLFFLAYNEIFKKKNFPKTAQFISTNECSLGTYSFKKIIDLFENMTFMGRPALLILASGATQALMGLYLTQSYQKKKICPNLKHCRNVECATSHGLC